MSVVNQPAKHLAPPHSAPPQFSTPWTGLPGWGIAPDLLPPEVIAGRQLREVRRRVVLGLAVVLILCVLGFGFGLARSLTAAGSLASEQDRTAQLQTEQNKYGNIMKIEGTIAEVQRQVAGLMAMDVNYAGLVDQLRTALPAEMSITRLQITVDTKQAGTSGGSAGQTSNTGGGALDLSGGKHIGSITISGTEKSLTDLPRYLDQLKRVKGVVEPYPTANTAEGSAVTYTVQATLTDQLLTHKFDAPKNGGN